MGAAIIATHVMVSAPASACINGMHGVRHGVIPFLVISSVVAGIISVMFAVADRRRAEPLSPKNRRRVILAIFALLTVLQLINYGVRFEQSEWRLFDAPVNDFVPFDPEATVKFET